MSEDAEHTSPQQQARVPGRPFQPGQSGNPAGRPKGARSQLSEDFLKALRDDFGEHGTTAIQQMREQDAPAYCKTIASLLPKVLQGSDDPEAAPIAIAYRWAEAPKTE